MVELRLFPILHSMTGCAVLQLSAVLIFVAIIAGWSKTKVGFPENGSPFASDIGGLDV